MANKSKSTKSKSAPKAETLTQEKDVEIEVKQLLKDERTHKIAGSICLLVSILLFIAFTSYLFTWDEDQDKVFQEGADLLLGTDVKVANLMGTFGAFISHFFIYKGFGIASYLICSFFFVLGVNLFFGKKVFSIPRNIKYIIVGLPLVSVTAAVIMNGLAFPWGGAVGDMCKEWMYRTIGQIGTVGIIAVAFLAYVIWRFNPAFRIPGSKKAEESILNEEQIDLAKQEWPDNDNSVEAAIKGNTMKGNAGMMPVIDSEPLLKHDISIVEKEPVKIEKLVEEIPLGVNVEEQKIVPQKIKPVSTASPLELEIKKMKNL